MNQNTREVEDIVDELYSLAWQDGSEGLNRRSALNERFQSAIHHQLQKAREEERKRIANLVVEHSYTNDYGDYMGDSDKILQAIHSELDQDKK